MRLKAAMVLLILFSCCLLPAAQPSRAQEAGNVINLQLSFHNYSLILQDANGSLYVYDGADGAAPSQASASQTNLNAQISGQRSGFNYWSAIVMWAVQLQSDVHVSGSVNVRAFISSTYRFSGLIAGGGYGMGLVDIDENNNEVKEFITESQPIMGNPFSATPIQYSLSTNVDHTFKKGHAIGFAVGLGGTEQGFTATVYFGSPERNSGATLPVEEATNTYIFTTNYNGATHIVGITSNSLVSDCQFDQATGCIQFKTQGISYTSGTCSVAIPKTLIQSPFTVTQGTQTITTTVTDNATHNQLTFTSTRSTTPIQITAATTPPTSTTANSNAPSNSPPVPEVNPLIILPSLVAACLLALLAKKRLMKKSSWQYSIFLVRIFSFE